MEKDSIARTSEKTSHGTNMLRQIGTTLSRLLGTILLPL